MVKVHGPSASWPGFESSLCLLLAMGHWVKWLKLSGSQIFHLWNKGTNRASFIGWWWGLYQLSLNCAQHIVWRMASTQLLFGKNSSPFRETPRSRSWTHTCFTDHLTQPPSPATESQNHDGEAQSRAQSSSHHASLPPPLQGLLPQSILWARVPQRVSPVTRQSPQGLCAQIGRIGLQTAVWRKSIQTRSDTPDLRGILCSS